MDEDKLNRLNNGEEIILSIEDYLKWRNYSPENFTPLILQRVADDMRILWTKKSVTEIIYDIFYDKF